MKATSRPLLLLLLVLGVVGVLAALSACGGKSSDGSSVASLEDVEGAADGAGTPSDDGADAGSSSEAERPDNFQDSVLEFAACMREEGIDVPDPDFSGNTPGGGFFRGNIDPNDPEVRAAFDKCQSALDGIRRQFTPEQQAELQDAIVEFAACMREQGIDMPDPDFSGNGSGPGGRGGGVFGGGAIDLDDPEVRGAIEECREFLPGGGRFDRLGPRGG